MAVLGVDGCKGGWVGIRLGAGGDPTAFAAPGIAALVALGGPVEVVAIDIPIGLPHNATRLADGLARKAIGLRASSVFSTPMRAVLAAATHAEANQLSRDLCGVGLTQQAFALGPKILEVDAWVTTADVQVVEVHPEVSFAVLAGTHLADSKSTWAGFEHRRRLLADAGIVLDGDLGLSGVRAGPDDVLDAAVAAWTALRVSRGEHVCLPDPPELLPDGRRSAIWA